MSILVDDVSLDAHLHGLICDSNNVLSHDDEVVYHELSFIDSDDKSDAFEELNQMCLRMEKMAIQKVFPEKSGLSSVKPSNLHGVGLFAGTDCENGTHLRKYIVDLKLFRFGELCMLKCPGKNMADFDYLSSCYLHSWLLSIEQDNVKISLDC